MATVKNVLFKVLTENADVAAMITSANGVKRLYPMGTPDNVPFPAISYRAINKDTSIGERLDGPADLVGEVFAFDFWASKKDATGRLGSEVVEELAKKVKAVLRVTRGVILAVDIQKISLENEFDGYESDLELYRVTQQYRVFHREG